jgi:hypothetical protein
MLVLLSVPGMVLHGWLVAMLRGRRRFGDGIVSPYGLGHLQRPAVGGVTV